MTYRLKIQPRAMAGALIGFHWLSRKSPVAAERWMTGLSKKLTSLNKLPEIHPIAEDMSELFGFPVRETLYGKRPNVYQILFTVDADTVIVIAIRHGVQGPIEP